MNKKRKILTLVALAVFGVIILLRCSGLPAYHHSYWKNADVFDLVDKNTVTRTLPSQAPAGAPDWAREPLVASARQRSKIGKIDIAMLYVVC